MLLLPMLQFLQLYVLKDLSGTQNLQPFKKKIKKTFRRKKLKLIHRAIISD